MQQPSSDEIWVATEPLPPVSDPDFSTWGTIPFRRTQNTGKREIRCHSCSKQFDYDQDNCNWNKFINSTQYDNSHGSQCQVKSGFEISADKYPISICNTCIQSIPSERITSLK